MKLMSKSYDEEIVKYANEVLKNSENTITAEKIMAYDIPKFIQNVSRDVAH